ncbi:MAG: hypothetical protein JXA00_02150 [Candidatus Thermoplasmatota archaeon]|nr:hypothetical protein [Candidatus Thermoplasmatota archaeon]
MFCVECGNEAPIFRNGVCLGCYLKSTQFSKGPRILDVTLCPRCSTYKYKNTWLQESFEDILKRQVKDSFTINPELTTVDIKTSCEEKDRIFSCTVTVSGVIQGQSITEQHPVTVRIKHSTCDVCSREAGGYYEAILQLRTEQKTFTKQEVELLQNTVEHLIEGLQQAGKRKLFLTDYEVKREGLDFFLSDKGAALSIAKKIQEQFGGDFKQSSSSAGMKDSRQIYRMTYLVRLPPYHKGDFFSWGDVFYTIVSVHANKVRVVDLATWEETVIEGKDVHPSRIYGGRELIRELILVSQTRTELQLMHPKTYAITEVRKPTTKEWTGEMIKTVTLDDHLFIYPEQ